MIWSYIPVHLLKSLEFEILYSCVCLLIPARGMNPWVQAKSTHLMLRCQPVFTVKNKPRATFASWNTFLMIYWSILKVMSILINFCIFQRKHFWSIVLNKYIIRMQKFKVIEEHTRHSKPSSCRKGNWSSLPEEK